MGEWADRLGPTQVAILQLSLIEDIAESPN